MNIDDLVSGLDDLDKLVTNLDPESTTAKPTKKPINPKYAELAELKYHWLYSARGGAWWHFDMESNDILENAFIMGINPVLKQFNAKIDCQNMTQTTSRGQRNIKRVDTLEGLNIRGIAGKYF